MSSSLRSNTKSKWGQLLRGSWSASGLHSLRGRKKRRCSARRLGAPEVLERREVFAAGISLTGGVLALTADPAGSQIVVSDPTPFSTGTNTAVLVITTQSPNGNWSTAVPKAAVVHLHFNGSSVSDSFDASSLGLSYYGMPLAVAAYGNGGADHLEGGMGNDTLDGGGDGDYLVGNGGRDTLIGGSGNDRLYGDSDASPYGNYTDSGNTPHRCAVLLRRQRRAAGRQRCGLPLRRRRE